MEVHTHTHTSRKKWTHYLWEFLMLFLAVFCGFLAENFREHYVDREKEKDYMQSMVKDLQRDTAFLGSGFPRKEERINAVDSVFLFFESHKDPNEIPGYVAAQIKRTAWDRQYDRSSGTINQLKNAGGMRLIRNKEVADSIAAYDLLWERADFWKQGYISLQNINYMLGEKILSPDNLLPVYRSNTTNLGPSLRQLSSVKINNTYLDEYLNFLWRQKTWTKQDYDFYKNMNESAVRLIELIKKEYHLE